jgi:hypothetical protein
VGEGAARAEARDAATPPSAATVEERPAHQRRTEVARRHSVTVDGEARRRPVRSGQGAPQHEPVGQGRGGELPTSGLLEGDDGLLAVGEVVERLSRIARRVAARPADQHVRPAVAHLKLKQLLNLVLWPAVLARDGGGARRRRERGGADRGGGVRD